MVRNQSDKEIMNRHVFSEGRVIFEEGSKGDTAFLVQEGRVQIFKTDENGVENILGHVEKGGIFGELALIDHRPRMASARALERTVVITVDHRVFDQKMVASDGTIKAVLRILLGNYRDMVKRVARAEAKLAEHGISID